MSFIAAITSGVTGKINSQTREYCIVTDDEESIESMLYDGNKVKIDTLKNFFNYSRSYEKKENNNPNIRVEVLRTACSSHVRTGKFFTVIHQEIPQSSVVIDGEEKPSRFCSYAILHDEKNAIVSENFSSSSGIDFEDIKLNSRVVRIHVVNHSDVVADLYLVVCGKIIKIPAGTPAWTKTTVETDFYASTFTVFSNVENDNTSLACSVSLEYELGTEGDGGTVVKKVANLGVLNEEIKFLNSGFVGRIAVIPFADVGNAQLVRLNGDADNGSVQMNGCNAWAERSFIPTASLFTSSVVLDNEANVGLNTQGALVVVEYRKTEMSNGNNGNGEMVRNVPNLGVINETFDFGSYVRIKEVKVIPGQNVTNNQSVRLNDDNSFAIVLNNAPAGESRSIRPNLVTKSLKVNSAAVIAGNRQSAVVIVTYEVIPNNTLCYQFNSVNINGAAESLTIGDRVSGTIKEVSTNATWNGANVPANNFTFSLVKNLNTAIVNEAICKKYGEAYDVNDVAASCIIGDRLSCNFGNEGANNMSAVVNIYIVLV